MSAGTNAVDTYGTNISTNMNALAASARLHRLAWAAEIGDDPAGTPEAEGFAFGVERILDAVQALIDRA